MQPKLSRFAVLLAGVLMFPAAAQTDARTASATAPTPLPVVPPVLLNGKPFPPVTRFVASLAAPRRTLFVAAGGKNGDGSESRPWNNLQSALCALGPGDRLRVRAGRYTGDLRIDKPCRDGTASEPIQVFFDGKATIGPGSGPAALTIRRSYWHLVGLFLKLDESPAAGVSIESSGAQSVTLDNARISGGAGPGVRIGEGSGRVTISNSRIAKSKLSLPGPDAVGIEVTASTGNVLLSNNRLRENPAGSVRVDAPAPGGRPASDLEIVGNTIRDDGAAAVSVASATSVRIADNTIVVAPGRSASSGIVLEEVNHAVVRRNHISNCGVAVQVGRVDPKGNLIRAAQDVTIDHNYLENALGSGAAVDIEAGGRVRFVNNVVEGYAQGILVLGKRPLTRGVVVANNLFLGVTETAFALADPAVVALFDYNVYSPSGESLNVEAEGVTRTLALFLKEGTMPNTRLVPGVRILDRDMAHISGVETVDHGTPVRGVEFAGRAPDLGVAEQ